MKKLLFLFLLCTAYLSYSQNIKKEQDRLLNILTLAIKNNDELVKNETYFLIGQSYLTTSSFKALQNFDLATEYLVENNHDFLSDLFFQKSNIYTTYSEFPKALELALKSLQYNQKQQLESKTQRDLSHIGYIHDRMYEYRTSIKWNLKSLLIAEKLKDTAAIARCFGRIGIAYDELAENDGFNKVLFDSALYFNKKAAVLSELSGNLGIARRTYSNIGNSYSKLRLYDKAEEYTLKSLAVPGFEESKGVTLVNLGKIFLETGRYAEAKKMLDSAMANTIKYGTRKYQFEAYYRFHELDVKKGDYKNALENYIAYKSIEDSLLNQTKNKQVIETRERFETAEKEKQILTQRAELAEQELEIKSKNLYALLLGFGVVLLGGVSYANHKYQKNKRRQLREKLALKDELSKTKTHNKLQEQRLRISRDLHDNIGSQLTFIISSIDNLKFLVKSSDEKLKSKLTNINNFASSTISQLRDTIWAMNKNEIPYDDFHTRVLALIEKAKLAKDSIQFTFESKVASNIVFSSVTGITIFRVLQEAINNAIKYSEASKVKIEILEKNDQLEIKITDNGKGFNITTVEMGNGLENMQRRMEEVDGKINIHSKLSEGTSIIITIKNT
ncbi:MAG: sensor histidine kinase [Flavobacteriaceae bacterium]